MTYEKLYLITEEQIEGIEEGDIDFRSLRSHPYNPQAEQGMNVEEFTALAGKMETAIRKDEREKILDNLIKKVGYYAFYPDDDRNKYISMSKLEKIVEELQQ